MHGENHISKQHMDIPDEVARDSTSWDAMIRDFRTFNFSPAALSMLDAANITCPSLRLLLVAGVRLFEVASHTMGSCAGPYMRQWR